MPLIVFEGIDGCGKSTQFDLLRHRLDERAVAYLHFRDPGATRLGERLRTILLDPANHVSDRAELFGYLLSRAQLVEEHLKPALARNELILMDRFYHSTIAYQAFGLGLDHAAVQAAVDLGVDGVHPDLVLWFRLDPEIAAARRNATRRTEDRIEGRGLEYLRRVHMGYAAQADDGRTSTLDGGLVIADLAAQVWSAVKPYLPNRP